MTNLHEKEPLTTATKYTEGTSSQSPDATATPLSRDHGFRSSGGSTEDCSDAPRDMPVALDGGYGWIVVGASFFVNFVVNGLGFVFGIFFLEFLDHYDEGKETTSWVGSVLNGMYLAMGPAVGVMVNKFGCRSVTIAGSLLASGSLIVSTFSPNVYVLILTYGLLTGIGFGMMYLPAIVIVGYYFDKRRALATGISLCGSGIGAFVFAPVCEKLIEMYSWKGATWIIAAICLNGIVCGFVFKPLEDIPRKRSRTSCSEAIQVLSPASDVQEKKEVEDISKHRPVDDPNISRAPLVKSMQNLSASCDEGSIIYSAFTSRSCDDMHMYGELTSGDVCKRQGDLKNPTCHNDVMYSGSVKHMTENTERKMSTIPLKSSARHRGICATLKNACKAVIDTLKQMLDFTLLGSPVFCIYGFSCFLVMSGYFIPFTYLPDMAISYGMSRDQAAFLISIIGIANSVIRVACGWVSDQPWADCLIINNCALVIGGVATILCPFCYTYPLLAVYSFVFGSCVAVFVSLRSIIIVDLMGLEKLTSAFGLVTFCQGMSALIGPPIAGAFFDATGYYNVSFYVAGSTLAMAGIICFPLRRVAAWWNKRKLRKELGGSTHTRRDHDGSSDDDMGQICSNENSMGCEKV